MYGLEGELCPIYIKNEIFLSTSTIVLDGEDKAPYSLGWVSVMGLGAKFKLLNLPAAC